MKSTDENSNYDRIVNILKNSRPELTDPEETGDEIIRRIRARNQRSGRIPGLVESGLYRMGEKKPDRSLGSAYRNFCLSAGFYLQAGERPQPADCDHRK